MTPPALPSHLPHLAEDRIMAAIPNITGVALLGNGGQRVVYKAICEGKDCVIKIALLPIDVDLADALTTDTGLRAVREIDILQRCTSDHMVKMGPIPLGSQAIDGQKVIYFSEEFIDGKDIAALIQTNGHLTWKEVVEMGLQITDAIKALKSLDKIHRDITPKNIMKRSSGSYVLLDAGLAFDVFEPSISAGGLPVGTFLYFSPEQFDYSFRRKMDFRTDIFSLGVTMYCAMTGVHPFWNPRENLQVLQAKITTLDPAPPSTIIAGIPPDLDAILLRMLGKKPHLRFRTCEELISAFSLLL